jgi:hypothetical protein
LYFSGAGDSDLDTVLASSGYTESETFDACSITMDVSATQSFIAFTYEFYTNDIDSSDVAGIFVRYAIIDDNLSVVLYLSISIFLLL